MVRERKGKQRKNIRKMMGLRTGEEAEGRFSHKGKHGLQRRTEVGTLHQALDVKVTDVGLPHHISSLGLSFLFCK